MKELAGSENYKEYFLRNDILFKYDNGLELIVVPKIMQSEVIRKAHKIGHFSVIKTADTVQREFYIPKLTDKIKNCIKSCIPCILGQKKEGKKEGMLHPIPKSNYSLCTYHIDHLGPMPTTNKNYQHLLVVKFVWIYTTRSTTSKEVIDRLTLQQKTFGNPSRIISDKGTAFTSKEFEDYCTNERIQHVTITTGVPRGNGQVERINRIIIPVLTKLSLENPNKWYLHVDRLQRILNSTHQRSINMTPFEILYGVKIRNKEDLLIKDLIESELIEIFSEKREELREEGKKQILKVQNQNRKQYNLRRKKATKYKLGDMVAVKRTQFGGGLKLSKKFLGPYEVTNVLPNESLG